MVFLLSPAGFAPGDRILALSSDHDVDPTPVCALMIRGFSLHKMSMHVCD